MDDGLDLKEEAIGALQAPLDVGDVELRGALPACGAEFDMDGNDDFVIGAVKTKNSMEFDVEDAGRAQNAFDGGREKDSFGILLGLENVGVHFVVTGRIAGVAAGDGHGDFAAGFAGLHFDAEAAPGDGKSTANGVEGGVHVEIDAADIAIDGEVELRTGKGWSRSGRGGAGREQGGRTENEGGSEDRESTCREAHGVEAILQDWGEEIPAE